MKTITDIMIKLDMQAEIKKKVIEVAQTIDLDLYKDDIIALTDIKTASEAKDRLKEKLAPDNGNIKILTCMLYALNYTYVGYKDKGISKTIFIDTMKAFRRFVQEHYNGNQKWAFDRDWWIYRQLAMTIFRIGELEYEMKNVDGNKYISMHIPSDANLKPDKVKQSLNEALDFFRKYYLEYSEVKYVCSSWLLSSDLVNVLDEESNILKFRELFDILRENYNSSGFIKWIYKTEYSDLNDLPEDTSLQRNLKQYLLAGNSVSVAYGELDFERIK